MTSPEAEPCLVVHIALVSPSALFSAEPTVEEEDVDEDDEDEVDAHLCSLCGCSPGLIWDRAPRVRCPTACLHGVVSRRLDARDSGFGCKVPSTRFRLLSSLL